MQIKRSEVFLLMIIFILLRPVVSAAAEFDWTGGLTLESAFDTNPASIPEISESSEDSVVLSLSPFWRIEWQKDRHHVQTTGHYIRETYHSSDDIHDKSSLSMKSLWRFNLSDDYSLFVTDNLIQSAFGPEQRDIPFFRGRSLYNEILTGLDVVPVDNLIVTTAILWRTRDYQAVEKNDSTESVFAYDWSEFGFQAEGKYTCIPQLQFLSSLSWTSRQFDDYDLVPGHNRTNGMFGFSTTLPGGSNISVHAHLYHMKFDGIVPRHMNANYTNYGMSLSSSFPLATNLTLSVDAFSKFDVSERGPRLFYHDRGISTSLDYNCESGYSWSIFYQFHQLEYDGQEPIFKTRSSYTGGKLTRYFNEWLSVTALYRYYDYQPDFGDFSFSRHHAGVSLTLMLPS
ncbi:hypothetical protein JW823_05050 [bacterium]|nr:hypothetical protein [candidate division CSSED10-310 bacterium]